MSFKLHIFVKIAGLFIFLLALFYVQVSIQANAKETTQNNTQNKLPQEDIIHLANYTAVYDLRLDAASTKSGITNYIGRMVYDFKGDMCDGYTSQVRFVSRVDGVEMQTMLNDYQISTFESGDGKTLRFIVKNLTNEILDREREGTATRDGKVLTVQMVKPEKKEITLNAAQYPTFETIEMIKRALKGETFYQSIVFDGTDDDDKLSNSTIFIGKSHIQEVDKSNKVLNPLTKMIYWPVTVTYFDDDKNLDGLPVYRTSFLLYKNGVTRDMLMDYGNFSVRAKLVDLIIDKDSQKQNCEYGEL